MPESQIVWDDGRNITPNEISEFESKLGIALPNDYKDVIKNYDGGTPNLPAIDFGGMIEKVFTGLIPLMRPNEYNDPITEIIARYKGRFPEGVIPFGDDPFGNMYCFDYRKNTLPIIVYWDHEMGVNEEGQFCIVANNFTDFLNMLYEQEDEN